MLPAESTKERLLDEARDLYLEVGPAGFSLREVARRSHLTAAAVYRHYDGKDALLGAVCAEGFRVFASYLMQSLEKPKPLDRMRAMTAQYLKFALDRPRDYRVIFMSEVPARLEAAAATQSPTPAPSFQFLLDRVRECMDEKVFRKADVRETAVTIWAHVHGLVSLYLAGHLGPIQEPREFSSVFARSTEHLLAGLK
ncbi:TetR/AcrR family transcriptional regulator [soil metagenome]